MTIILSIKPYYLYLILIGKKTIELRKSFPQRKEWDKTAFLYCTKDKKSFAEIPEEDQGWMRDKLGKIACKIVVDKFYKFIPSENGFRTEGIHSPRALHESCLRIYQIKNYLIDTPGYGWHISYLMLFEPREITEFVRVCADNCKNCGIHVFGCECDRLLSITFAPQSWCYALEVS